MTSPNAVFPGYYMLTRRTLRSMFRLKPSREVNELIESVVTQAAKLYNIRIIAFKALSSHWHAIINDRKALHPRFTQYVNSLLARALNLKQDTEDAFWSCHKNASVYIPDAETLLRLMVYVMGNSVTSFLTDKANQWPGFKSLPRDIGSLRKEVKRSKILFTVDGTMPEVSRLRLYDPDLPGISAIIGAPLNAKNLRKYLAKEISLLEARTRKERKEAKRQVVGRERILAASPFDTPSSRKHRVLPTGPDGKSVRIAPRIATRNEKIRKAFLWILKRFHRRYAEARSELNEGMRISAPAPTFPFGTYKLRLEFLVPCEEVPLDFPVDLAQFG